MVYSDETSMVSSNGGNGDTTLLVIKPQVVEEPEIEFMPQAQTQLVASLFGC